MSQDISSEANSVGRTPWRVRVIMVIVVTLAVTVVWWTNHLLTERFTEGTRNRAEVRLALYSGNVQSEL